MSQELHYTSVPRGLKPGSRGFCTVAATAQMSGTLIERLEAISGYEPVFPPNDPAAALNPIAYSHLRVPAGTKVVSVVSRIGPAALDYSGRPNKYAHHIVLERNERPEGGPAWLLSRPGFVQAAWDGEPREIPQGRTPPQGDRQPGLARAWQMLTDDAGWAGTLAETFLADPKRPVFLVFRPGMAILPLFEEALAFLPSSRRWDVDFSTYFSQLPQGVTCTWRGVLEGSEEANNARRLPNALILDLCSPLRRAEGGVLVHLARTGERRQAPDTSAIAPPSAELSRNPTSTDPRRTASAGLPAGYELIAGLSTTKPGSRIPPLIDEEIIQPRRRPRRLAAILAGSFVILSVIGAVYLGRDIIKLVGFDDDASQLIAEVQERVSKDKQAREVLAQQNTAPSTQKEENTAVTKESGEQQQAQAKVGEPKVPPKKEDNQTKTPAASEPVPQRPRPQKPIVFASRLPAISMSAITSGPKSTSYPLDLKDKVKDHIDILNAPGFERPKPDGTGTLRIASITKSLAGGRSEIAHFGLDANNKKLTFNWEGQAGNQSELVEALKDAVLALDAEDGNRVYVLLRHLETNRPDPLDLTNKTKAESQHDLKDPIQTAQWANSDALIRTRWKLGIRRWKLVVSPTSSGEKPLPFESKSAATGESFLDTNEHHLSDEARFKLWVNPDKPAELQAKTYVSDVSKNVLANLTSKQAEASSRLRIEKDQNKAKALELELKDLQQEIGGLKKKIHDLLSGRFELSVVIGLKVDNQTILDIAKIGDFANSP